MFCKYCGKEIVEGSKFCEECGKEVALPEETANEPEVKEEVAAPEQPEEVTEAPATEETPAEPVTEEAPVEAVVEEKVAEPTFAEPQFDAPVKKGKKKKVVAILIPVIAVLVAAAVVATMFFGVIKGFFVKTFGSDEDYFRFVETKAFASVTDDFTEFYGTTLENLKTAGTDAAVSETIKLNVGDKVIDLLEKTLKTQTDTEVDLAWLDKITINMDAKAKNNVDQLLAAVNINGKELVNMDLIIDMDKGELFVAFLSLSDKYLKGAFQTDEETQKLMDILYDEDLRIALPEQDKLDKLLDKYAEVVFENIDDVDKSSDVIKIGDIEQKLTVLEAEIDQEDALDIASAVLKTAQKDDELKTYIKDIAKYLEKQEIISDSSDVYDSFKDYIEEAIDAIDGTEIDEDDDSVIVWSDYVNSKNEIVGRKFAADDNEILYYALVRDGNEFAYEFECQEFVISGKGTDKKNVVNAQYTVKYEGDEICDITVIDYKTNSDYLNGKFRIAPSDDLIEEIGLDSNIISALSIANPMIEFNVEGGKNLGKMDLNIVSGDQVLIGFTATIKEAKPSNVKKPDSSDVYEEDEVDKWASELDAQKLLEKLKEVGISSELIDAIESLMYSSYDDSYNDFDYNLDDTYSDYDFYY